jgi:hypothetical protein
LRCWETTTLLSCLSCSTTLLKSPPSPVNVLTNMYITLALYLSVSLSHSLPKNLALDPSLNTKIWYASKALIIHIGRSCDCCIPCHTIASGKGPYMHICCTYSRGSHQGIGGNFKLFLHFKMWINCHCITSFMGLICQFFLPASRLLNKALYFFNLF